VYLQVGVTRQRNRFTKANFKDVETPWGGSRYSQNPSHLPIQNTHPSYVFLTICAMLYEIILPELVLNFANVFKLDATIKANAWLAIYNTRVVIHSCTHCRTVARL